MAANYVAAEMLLQEATVVDDEDSTLYAASWATLLTVRDRAAEAIEILEERLEDHSTDPNLLLSYGVALEKLKNFDEAEDAFREALANDEESPGALRGLSNCLERKGDFVGACKLAAKAFTILPDNLLLAKNAANLLEKAGQIKTAGDVLELGAFYNHDDEELVVRAVTALLTKNEPERAGELLSVLDDTLSWAAAWKANFLDWQGQTEEANRLIQKTLERNAGESLDFLFHLCCILLRRGEVAAVEAYLNHILAADPQHPGATRMNAEFAMGQYDYNPSVDPLGAAVAASTELPGWSRFWWQLQNGDTEAAEETLGLMADDEELASSALELARLELAEFLLLSLSTGEFPNELSTLDDLPDEASSGLVLEFLEILDERYQDTPSVSNFREFLSSLLAEIAPVLRLTRFYVTGDWRSLGEALEEFDESPSDLEGVSTHRLFTFLHSLGTEDEAPIDVLNLEEDEEFAAQAFDVLLQRRERNRVEQRFVDKMNGHANRIKDVAVPESEPNDETPEYQAGGIIDTKDVEIIYENEDGEIIEDFDEEEYELVEEVEIDPNDEDYEYVWVEEEVTDEAEPEMPEDSY